MSRCLHSQIYQSDSLLALPMGTFSAEFVIFRTSHWRDIEIITPNVWPLLPSEYRLRPSFWSVREDGVNWRHLSCLERAESFKWLLWSTWMASSKGALGCCVSLCQVASIPAALEDTAVAVFGGFDPGNQRDFKTPAATLWTGLVSVRCQGAAVAPRAEEIKRCGKVVHAFHAMFVNQCPPNAPWLALALQVAVQDAANSQAS